MKINSIQNNTTFKSLIIESPKNFPIETLEEIISNDEILILSKALDDKGRDLSISYQGDENKGQISLFMLDIKKDGFPTLGYILGTYDKNSIKDIKADEIISKEDVIEKDKTKREALIQRAQDFVNIFNEFLKNN